MIEPGRKSQLSRFAEWMSVVIVVSPLVIFGLLSLNKISQMTRDNIRLGDLNQVAVALEMYYNGNRRYPGESGRNQWSVLEKVLDSRYVSSMPADPKGGVYEYWVSASGQNYVLNATMELPEEEFLKSDLDGKVFGCDCDDEFGGQGGREYCFKY